MSFPARLPGVVGFTCIMGRYVVFEALPFYFFQAAFALDDLTNCPAGCRCYFAKLDPPTQPTFFTAPPCFSAVPCLVCVFTVLPPRLSPLLPLLTYVMFFFQPSPDDDLN